MTEAIIPYNQNIIAQLKLIIHNQDLTIIQLDSIIEDIVISSGITNERIRSEYAAFIDKSRRTRLVVTDPIILEKCKICYDKMFKIKERSITHFNFTTNKIINGTIGCCKEIKQMNNDLFLVISGDIIRMWEISPHINEFEEVARTFNIIANRINIKFKLGTEGIQLAISPKPKKKRSKMNYIRSLIIDPMTGDRPINPILDQTIWFQKFQERIQINDFKCIVDMELLKFEDKTLYGNISNFHNKEMRTLHRNNKSNRCRWPKNGLAFLANQFIQRLALGKITQDNLKTMCFGFPGDKPIKLPPLLQRTRPIVGNYYVKCPCIKKDSNGDAYECGICFHLNDKFVLQAFKNTIFANPPVDSIESINAFFVLVNTKINAPQETHRTHPLCPNCHTIGYNYEAILNNTGTNPEKKHPSDYICLECNLRFCTDCGSYHPGSICRGFPENTNPGDIYQACPKCTCVCERIDGCPHIICPNHMCGAMWCWICRCCRYEEQGIDADGTRNHYCMTINRFHANIIWDEDPNFEPYEENAPQILNIELNEYVPL
jgi:hypothetical protein